MVVRIDFASEGKDVMFDTWTIIGRGCRLRGSFVICRLQVEHTTVTLGATHQDGAMKLGSELSGQVHQASPLSGLREKSGNAESASATSSLSI